MSGCRRTVGILDTWIETGEVSGPDARHMAGCRHCAAAFARVDVIDGEIRTAVRSLVLEASAVGIGSAPQTWRRSRTGTPRLRFGAGLASLAAVVVLVVVAGIRLSTAPAAPAEPLLPVPVRPAEQALHQSGLRCTEVAAGLECTRGLADGWQQVATLEVTGGDVRGLEVRLLPGSGPFPASDVAAALAEPVIDVLGVDVADAVEEAVACGCARPIEGGTVRVEGDPVAGYRLVIDATGASRP